MFSLTRRKKGKKRPGKNHGRIRQAFSLHPEVDWKERDEKILERIKVHPCTVRELEDLFESRTQEELAALSEEEMETHLRTVWKRVWRRLKILRKRKRVRIVGYYQVPDGRPRDVYCGWEPRFRTIEHEVDTTRFLLKFDAEMIRGHAVDPRLRPDATILDPLIHVEMDMGTMAYGRVRRRLQRYGDTVLFLTTTADRRDRVLEVCEMDNILAAVHSEALENPLEAWKNYQGETCRLTGLRLSTPCRSTTPLF